MNTIINWQLGNELSNDDALFVINELFSGAKKEFYFDKNEQINNVLYKFYQSFQDDKSSKYTIFFSNIFLEKPFISTKNFFDKYSKKIKISEGELYIYHD